ncbi:MAG: hypothetical protein KGL39_24155 [Patescibacteria group bacterium]|nr:hypothetical protein [Patescibacteria group bacterium]
MQPREVPISAPRLTLGDGARRLILTDLGDRRIRIVYPSGEGGDFDEDELRQAIAKFVSDNL